MIPVLMLGIGVDDMFVVCNALDQQSFDLPVSERIKRAMMHAGPSITITSVTDCIAFFIGSTSSLPAVQAFCIFCGVTVIMLYTCVITLFLSVLVFDTHRVAARRGDCCGLCFCAEDTVLCFRGRFLSPLMRKFSKLDDKAAKDLKQPKAPTQVTGENSARGQIHPSEGNALQKGKVITNQLKRVRSVAIKKISKKTVS